MSAKPGFIPGAAGWEARMLPLCEALPILLSINLVSVVFQSKRQVLIEKGYGGVGI